MTRVDDVSGQVQVEEKMVQSEKMLSVGGLAAGMAQEINNPLAIMMQNADVMNNRLTNLTMPANLRAAAAAGATMEAIGAFMKRRGIIGMLSNNRESGRRTAGIVTNMLNFSRKSDSKFTPSDLATWPRASEPDRGSGRQRLRPEKEARLPPNRDRSRVREESDRRGDEVHHPAAREEKVKIIVETTFLRFSPGALILMGYSNTPSDKSPRAMHHNRRRAPLPNRRRPRSPRPAPRTGRSDN